jgi:osmotically-inducible protein OsmY
MQQTDEELRDRVRDELDWDPSVHAGDIVVTVEGGVVTLAGHVSTYAQKTAAEAVAGRVRGVCAVVQKIQVRPDRDDWDEGIARRALHVLDWDVTIPRNAVRVKVSRGCVTLTGEVEWDYQRRAAEEAVRRLAGVVSLNNQITLRPGARPADLKRRIEAALQRNAELDAARIRVGVTGGKVILEGQVKARFERALAQQAAWSAPGVRAVEDHLRVGS